MEITKKAILDDVGIAFLGYDLEGGQVIEYARAVGHGAPEATLIGDGGKVSCLVAAGANAQMAQDTDFNETGPGHHIISPIAQTAISVAERTGSSGKNQVIAKFTAQAAGVIGDGPSGEIVDRIRVLEDEDDITGITALFGKE